MHFNSHNVFICLIVCCAIVSAVIFYVCMTSQMLLMLKVKCLSHDSLHAFDHITFTRTLYNTCHDSTVIYMYTYLRIFRMSFIGSMKNISMAFLDTLCHLLCIYTYMCIPVTSTKDAIFKLFPLAAQLMIYTQSDKTRTFTLVLQHRVTLQNMIYRSRLKGQCRDGNSQSFECTYALNLFPVV